MPDVGNKLFEEARPRCHSSHLIPLSGLSPCTPAARSGHAADAMRRTRTCRRRKRPAPSTSRSGCHAPLQLPPPTSRAASGYPQPDAAVAAGDVPQGHDLRQSHVVRPFLLHVEGHDVSALS